MTVGSQHELGLVLDHILQNSEKEESIPLLEEAAQKIRESIVSWIILPVEQDYNTAANYMSRMIAGSRNLTFSFTSSLLK